MHLHHSCSLKRPLLSPQTRRGSCILVAIVDGVGSTSQKLPTDFTVILCDQQPARREQRQCEQARKDEQSQYGLYSITGFLHSSNLLCHTQTLFFIWWCSKRWATWDPLCEMWQLKIKAETAWMQFRGGVALDTHHLWRHISRLFVSQWRHYCRKRGTNWTL